MNALAQILDEIGARLANITVANGYDFDHGKIQRARLTPFQTEDLPAINYWPAFDNFTKREFRKEDRIFNLRIEAYAMTRDDPFTDLSVRMANAVWISLNRATTAPMVTDDWSPNLGGLLKTSFNVRQFTPAIGQGETPWCGALLNLDATYRVDAYDLSLIT